RCPWDAAAARLWPLPDCERCGTPGGAAAQPCCLISLRSPAHLVGGCLRCRIDVAAGPGEAVLLVETDRAGVVLIDMQVEPVRRLPARVRQERFGDAAALLIGGDHDLVEIPGVRIDHQEAKDTAARERHEGERALLLEISDMIHRPGAARLEIDGRI